MTNEQIESIEATLSVQMPQRVTLDAVRATGVEVYCGEIWAAAMTMAFGTVGLHESRSDKETGFPLPETMTLASVSDSMERARTKATNILGWYRHQNRSAA